MSRPVFTLIAVLLVVVILLAMWIGWRARARRDASVRGSDAAPSGTLLAEFTRVLYVSTTPVGEPLQRVAAPGLRYRGQAVLTVYTDGVTVAVVGEEPMHFSAVQLRGSGSAGRRVGKAVEPDGLGLMRWVAVSDASGSTDADDPRVLESSFRFEQKADQIRFSEVLNQISNSSAVTPATQPTTSQEDAK